MLQFTLYYRGPLRANGNTKHKHEIRERIHEQLKVLWNSPPLDSWSGACLTKDDRDPGTYIVRELRGVPFAPLICSTLSLSARLDIVMLRPEPPGRIISGGGDIDNRLKTLFDALRLPSGTNEIPPDVLPKADGEPFLTLLEDDALITHVSVRTEQLLEEPTEKSEVVLLIDVTTRATKHTVAASVLG